MYTIGIDLGGEGAKIGVIGRDVEPIWRVQIPLEPDGDILAKIVDFVREAALRYPIDRIGVCCAGKVDPATGRVWSDELGFDGAELRDILMHETNICVWVDNRAQAALQAEWTSGSCKGANHAIYLHFGDEISGALVCNGQPYRGRANGGAELGHIITHVGGEECACGMRGCYEAHASMAALERMAGRPPREALELARSGDRGMRDVIDEFCGEICVGLVSLLAVFEPEVVVIDGGIASRFFLEKIHRALQESGTWTYSEDVLITVPRHKADALVIGAASLAEYYIDDPEEFFAENGEM